MLSGFLRRAVVARISSSPSLLSAAPRRSPPRPRRVLYRNAMASSGSNAAVFGDFCIDDMIAPAGANGLDFSRPIGVFFGDRISTSCVKASVKMRSGNLPSRNLVCGYSVFDGSMQKSRIPVRNLTAVGPLLKNLHTSSTLCLSARPAHDVSFDGNYPQEQIEDDSHRVSGQTLKLLSGSCYLPHPDKEDTGGEDAHFICSDEQAIGVADGVGGWADVGINAGDFSRELMSNAVSAIQGEPKGSVDPTRVLEKAHSGAKAKGSSTACIIALTDEGIHAINLGDSGFMVVRDGCTIFQSPVQQHGFNFTYQLESGTRGDLPSSGQVFKVPVAPGDVIIAGTDGLFDNLYNNEVTAVVVHTRRAGLGPEATAQKIAALARQRAQDRNRQTPFSTAAQDAGYRYYGGKLDDITVVVSYITSKANV